MNNSSSNNNFSNTFSSMAYEQLTGLKAPVSSQSNSSAGYAGGASTNNHGTGRWAAGMASAGSVLGNLGVSGSAMDSNGGSSRNTTWDIPPHSPYGLQHASYTSQKENITEYRPRSRSRKRVENATSGGSSERRHNTAAAGYKGDCNDGVINTYSSATNTTTSKSNAAVSSESFKAKAGDDHFTHSSTDKMNAVGMSSSLASPIISSQNTEFSNALSNASRGQRRHSQENTLAKSKSSSTSNHESRSSTPSSNSNSLTKNKRSCVVDDNPDEFSVPNTNPYFHLTRNGVDQLEVLSDGDNRSISPEPVTDADQNSSSLLYEETALDVGSMVEIFIKGVPRCGVIRWIGRVPGDKKHGRQVAGVELEDGSDGLSDGTFDGRRHFTCAPGKAIFVNLSMCQQDRRFLESIGSCSSRASVAFGAEDCRPISGRVAPPEGAAVSDMIGTNKGIQGHQNSCYLDATLFSMFAFTSVFDSLLFRPATPSDIEEYGEVQEVLREYIVNPLRSRMFVRADRIMRLRQLLEHLSSVTGLTTEEKDPEEFLHCLLAQILKADPYLQLSSGQEAYHYQLFLDKDDKVSLPSVQHLFDQSFLTSDIKLKQVPPILILQMPRFGKDYKMYPRILPSLLLDVTDVIEDSPRQCIICGLLAEFECPQCFGQCGSGLESIAFCAKCIDKVHTHKKRDSHCSVHRLRVPQEYQMLADHCPMSVPRVYMELFAVVCIETSHYVTFTRCGEGANATWCFFDSMADRKGEQNGYNIPSVVQCGELLDWLGEQSTQDLKNFPDDKALPDLTRRLLCDAYMCFYQSTKVAMYR